MLAAYTCNSMFHDLIVIPMMQMFLLFIGGCAVTIYQRGLAAEPARSPQLVPAMNSAVLSKAASSGRRGRLASGGISK